MDVMKLLRSSDKYCDLVIKSRDLTHKVHRAVVCPQCKFLETAVTSNFHEAETGEINMREDDSEAVQELFDFFYTQTFDSVDPLFCIRVNVIADKYDVQPLKKSSEDCFKTWASNSDNWSRKDFDRAVLETLQLEHSTGLKDIIIDLIVRNSKFFLGQHGVIELLKLHGDGEMAVKILQRASSIIEAKPLGRRGGLLAMNVNSD